MDERLFKRRWKQGATRAELMREFGLGSLSAVTWNGKRLGLPARIAGKKAVTDAAKFARAWKAGRVKTAAAAARYGYASMDAARLRAKRLGLET